MRPTITDRHALAQILISAQLQMYTHNGGAIKRIRSRK